ncbi:MAG TPA: MBOAT family protein, partial [Rudaea sp.]
MLFDTFGYWIFFAAVLIALAALRPQPGKWLLVAASYVFYACWDPRFVLLLGASTLANWLFGLRIDVEDVRARKRALIAAIVFNLGTLAFFKYFNFFVDSFAALFHLDPHAALLRIVLPVGISFFTFEGIAYAIDIYRRDLPARRSLLDFALFISFFPHLIAGPIIRPVNFFPQTGRALALTPEDARWGLREILKGLFKKIVLSNFYAPIADAYFHATPWEGSAVPAWIGVLAFSMQIYFDFSGYTDIARGCARLLGFRFPPNFERPYLATDIADFWRRWHISLSSWLRDYLYIPLGGNRRGEVRTSANLLIVMGLGGLWHGASWNFAVWGLYHGVLLVVHRYWRRAIAGSALEARVDAPMLRPFWTALTFVLVTLGWIPFRAPDFATTAATLRAVAAIPDLSLAIAHPAIVAIPILALAFCLIDRE